MKKLNLAILFVAIVVSQKASAIYTEVGVNYSGRTTYFDENNSVKTTSTTLSASFYVWEKIGIELSHTQGVMERFESYTSNNIAVTSTVSQYQTVKGADIIFSFAGRKSLLQPYIKGGMAYIEKRQVITDNYGESEVKLDPGTAPSYGAGLKIMLSEAFAIKASYDTWKTPDSNSSIQDTAMRVGLTWIF
jgi:hypothetical protein